jgi:Flp pilus assembly protein TadD
VEEFASRNWWHYEAALALGRLYAQRGDVASAETALIRASRLDIREVEALNLIAIIRWRQNRLEEACATQRRAVARQPDEPQQYMLLASFLQELGRADEVRAANLQIARLRALAGTRVVVN